MSVGTGAAVTFIETGAGVKKVTPCTTGAVTKRPSPSG